MDIGSLLTLLLGGGAVATITALFNGVKSLREGARSRERDTIQDLIDRRKEADKEREKAYRARDRAFDQRDYWRNRCGVREFQLNSAGVPLKPVEAEPPDEPEDDDEDDDEHDTRRNGRGAHSARS